jgi:murein peptide amidase A
MEEERSTNRVCADRIDVGHWSNLFDELFRERGFVRAEICLTPAGPIVGWKRMEGEGLPTVYLSAGMHGDEPAGPLAVEAYWRGDDHRGVNWLVCPMLNPTGLSARTRDNAQGLDLNRDYLLRQSEEVRSHVAWLEKQKVPDLFLSLHEDWETEGFYFYEISLGEDRPQRARELLEAVSKVCPIETGAVIDDHLVRESGWIHHVPQADFPESWPEAIYLAKRGCPLSFTFETPSCALPLEQRIAAHGAAIRAAIENLFPGFRRSSFPQ